MTKFHGYEDFGLREPHDKYPLGHVTDVHALIDFDRIDLYPDFDNTDSEESFKSSIDKIEGARLHIADVYDPLLGEISEDRLAEILSKEFEYSQMAKKRRGTDWERKYTIAYDPEGKPIHKGWGDIGEGGTQRSFISDEMNNSKSYKAWLTHLPSAEALRYLSGPNAQRFISPARKKGSEIDNDEVYEIEDNLREWFIACTDARAIRSRAAVCGYVLSQLKNDSGQEVYEPSWLSVACGTAAPVFQTTYALNGKFKPRFTMVDNNEDALAKARELYAEFGLNGSILTEPANVFDFEYMKKFKAQILDAVGIFEYIGVPLLQRFNAKATKEESDVFAAEFLKMCHGCAEEKIIFGQMLDTRPNYHFTEGVIGWPYVVRRSPNDVINICKQAGISPEDVDIYIPKDGVYAIYVITKR